MLVRTTSGPAVASFHPENEAGEGFGAGPLDRPVAVGITGLEMLLPVRSNFAGFKKKS